MLPSEKRLWEKISVDDMSEESDDADDTNTLVVHKFPWRSLGITVLLLCLFLYCSLEMCQFLEKLDLRYQEKISKEGVLVARKNCKNGGISETLPCLDVPEWIIDPKWRKGIDTCTCTCNAYNWFLHILENIPESNGQPI